MNARYYHSSFGLRYLLANMEALTKNTAIVEFTIQQSASVIVDELLSRNPKIVGFGVYIWNVALTIEVVHLLKQRAPEVCVVLGGPEVSHEVNEQPLCEVADVVITGEADHTFREVCIALLNQKPLTYCAFRLKCILYAVSPVHGRGYRKSYCIVELLEVVRSGVSSACLHWRYRYESG